LTPQTIALWAPSLQLSGKQMPRVHCSGWCGVQWCTWFCIYMTPAYVAQCGAYAACAWLDHAIHGGDGATRNSAAMAVMPVLLLLLQPHVTPCRLCSAALFSHRQVVTGQLPETFCCCCCCCCCCCYGSFAGCRTAWRASTSATTQA
jgi:hypothetical protein